MATLKRRCDVATCYEEPKYSISTSLRGNVPVCMRHMQVAYVRASYNRMEIDVRELNPDPTLGGRRPEWVRRAQGNTLATKDYTNR